jgi:hypothetical protein
MSYWEARLHWIVRALAQPADEQRRLIPDFADAAEDLAVDFDAILFRANSENEPCAKVPAIVALNEQFDLMGTEANIWTDDALFSSPSWERVRVLARAAVEALGLPADSPGPDGTVVVFVTRPPSGTPKGGLLN